MDNQVAQLLIKQLQDSNLQLVKQLQDIHALLYTHFGSNQEQGTKPSNPTVNLDNLIDEYEVIQILKISRTTLYRLKRGSKLYIIKIGNKNYFVKDQIEGLIAKYMK